MNMLVYDNHDGKSSVIAGSKVVVVDKLNGNKQAIGLVKGEENGNLLVLLENRKEIVVRKPLYCKEDGIWEYHHNDENKYEIIELDPIRIKFLKSGFIHICFNKVILSNDKSKCLF